jgi:transcriptional regulator with XRE-family HTH domain
MFLLQSCLWKLTGLNGEHYNRLEMTDEEAIYGAIGTKMRQARERSAQKLSQVKLARILGVSRASIVNIEAGRQHASLLLLWRIAEVLETDLVQLIPRRAELAEGTTVVKLNDTMRKQIKLEADGNAAMEKKLTGIVGKLLTTIEQDRSGNGS